MSIRIDPTNLTVHVTTPRQTPEPASRRFSEALRQGASVILSGATAAAGALPGVPVVTAAIRGASDAAAGPAAVNAPGESAEAPGTGATGASGQPGQSDMERVMQESQAFNLYYLEIQEQMSRENRRFSALSNVMKARHETAKSAIGNIR